MPADLVNKRGTRRKDTPVAAVSPAPAPKDRRLYHVTAGQVDIVSEYHSVQDFIHFDTKSETRQNKCDAMWQLPRGWA